MKYLIPFSVLFILMFSSCVRIFFGEDIENTPESNYDYLCEIMDTRYSLFDIKKKDWESSKAEYRQLLRDSMSDEELLGVFEKLVGSLEDGHSNVYAGFNFTRNWDWHLDYPTNFNRETIERKYLGKSYWRTGGFEHTIIDSIGYIYYGSFSRPITGKQMNFVFDRMKYCKGIIFDIRNNGGGKLNNVKKLAAQFADKERKLHNFYFKTGPGLNEFTDSIGYSVKPAKNAFTKPTVILINRKSYSAGTFFPSAVRAFPHVTLMGDHSGGGGGIPFHFELPNGWEFRISTTRTIDMNGVNIEPGIEPDIYVSLDKDLLEKGKDSIIEAALDWIKNGGAKGE